MPAAKKKPKKKPAARARRSSSPLGLPTLDQRQLDLIGLGLVGLGLFFGFLVYAGWEGGRVGSQAVEALKWLLGAAHYSCRWRSSRAARSSCCARCCPPCGRSAPARSASSWP